MIRFGIIGTNWITDKFIEDASVHNDFRLTAVYSRTEEKAVEFAQKHNAEHTFTDLEEMAASDVIDAVYIASPTSLHAEQSILLMNYGKHVLCEKPLASNVKEVENMMAAAKQNGVVLMEAMKTTLLPGFTAIKENLHKIGPIRRYLASFSQYSSRYDAYKNGTVLNAFKPEFSNGSLMDLGVYCIYPMVVLFGEPEELKASGLMLESGVDGEGSVIFKYKEMEAVIMHSKITTSYAPAEIQGEKGSIIIDKTSSPNQVEIYYHNGEVEDISIERQYPEMYYEAAEFIRLIQKNESESAINSFKHSQLTATLLEQARKQIGIVFPADN